MSALSPGIYCIQEENTLCVRSQRAILRSCILCVSNDIVGWVGDSHVLVTVRCDAVRSYLISWQTISSGHACSTTGILGKNLVSESCSSRGAKPDLLVPESVFNYVHLDVGLESVDLVGDCLLNNLKMAKGRIIRRTIVEVIYQNLEGITHLGTIIIWRTSPIFSCIENNWLESCDRLDLTPVEIMDSTCSPSQKIFWTSRTPPIHAHNRPRIPARISNLSAVSLCGVHWPRNCLKPRTTIYGATAIQIAGKIPVPGMSDFF